MNWHFATRLDLKIYLRNNLIFSCKQWLAFVYWWIVLIDSHALESTQHMSTINDPPGVLSEQQRAICPKIYINTIRRAHTQWPVNSNRTQLQPLNEPPKATTTSTRSIWLSRLILFIIISYWCWLFEQINCWKTDRQPSKKKHTFFECFLNTISQLLITDFDNPIKFEFFFCFVFFFFLLCFGFSIGPFFSSLLVSIGTEKNTF